MYLINKILRLPYLGLHNAQDFAHSLFCRMGAHYKHEQCVSLFPRPGNHMSTMFFCLLLSTCKVKYFLNCLNTIPQNN
jgi:hypothetical protein